MKYHPAKVLQIYSPKSKDVLSADQSTQAMVEMWDENMFTFSVDAKIASKVKKNDIVLVDYNPTKTNPPIPKTVIIKILRGQTGKDTWKEFKEYHKKRKREKPTKLLVPSPPGEAPRQSYG